MDTKKYTVQHLHTRAQALNTRDQHTAQSSIKPLFLVYGGLCVTFGLFVDVTLLGNLAFM